MKKQYDYAVFIGRFAPFHNGHQEVIKEGLKQAKRVIVLVGSSFSPRNYRNPFTFDERSEMIRTSFYQEDQERINISPIEDCTYNDGRWVENIQIAVNNITQYDEEMDPKIALIGHSKDNSSFYLKLFPQWESISVNNVDDISSTDIRKHYFSNMPFYLIDWCTSGTQFFLKEFKNTEDYKNICEEYKFVEEYKKSWKSAPYEPIFVTVDACVIQSGHILLIQRKARPGKGLWALPGGFLNPLEKIEDAVIRELREETKIKVPVPVLKGSIVSSKVFDDPYRSSRGRTITHGFLFNLRPDISLPQVKGSDDATKAKWFPLSEVYRSMMFEDHMDILNYFTATL